MRFGQELRELAQRQHGVVARRQARALGLTPREVSRLARSDAWMCLSDEVIALTGSAPTPDRSAIAAVLDVGPPACLAATSAAWCWGLPGFAAAPWAVVTTTSTRRRSPLAEVRRTCLLPPRWCTVLRGIPVVRPELMVLQVFARMHPERAERALDNAWSRRLLSGDSCTELVQELGTSGRQGAAAFRRALARRGPDYTPPDSNLEARGAAVLAPLGLDFRKQVDSGGGCWSARVDLRADRAPVVVEIQSELHHSALLDREADLARRARLERDGFTVVEVTDVEVWYGADVVRRRVAEALAVATR